MADKPMQLHIPDQDRDSRRFHIQKAFTFREHAKEAYGATRSMPLEVAEIFREGLKAAERELDRRIKDYAINHLGLEEPK